MRKGHSSRKGNLKHDKKKRKPLKIWGDPFQLLKEVSRDICSKAKLSFIRKSASRLNYGTKMSMYIEKKRREREIASDILQWGFLNRIQNIFKIDNMNRSERKLTISEKNRMKWYYIRKWNDKYIQVKN